jgi:hypothetical protein
MDALTPWLILLTVGVTLIGLFWLARRYLGL